MFPVNAKITPAPATASKGWERANSKDQFTKILYIYLKNYIMAL